MKVFWSWQSDTPGRTGRFLVRDALQRAIEKLKLSPDVEDAQRDIELDHDIKGVTGSPDLARTIFEKIDKSTIVVADVTIVGSTTEGKKLINSNVAIELGYAFHARTDKNVLLVFNRRYGPHEDLPFDLRHKGGAITFDLAAEARRDEIQEQQTLLTDSFARSLRPLLTQEHEKSPLSLKANLKHFRTSVPGGGEDERYLLIVNLENDGELDATDFRLDVEVPVSFLDGGGYRLQADPLTPGFARFQVTSKDSAYGREHLYPGDRTKDIELFYYAVPGHIKRQRPELLGQKITATVYSGSMKPKKIECTISSLRG